MARFDVRTIAGAAALAATLAVTTAGATLAEEGPWDHGSVWDSDSVPAFPSAAWPGGVVWDHDGGWDDDHDGAWHDGQDSHHEGEIHGDGDHGWDD